MADKLQLSRAQLAQFLKDPQAIRQFERLFNMASILTPTQIDELQAMSAGITSELRSRAASIEQQVSALRETIPRRATAQSAPEVAQQRRELLTAAIDEMQPRRELSALSVDQFQPHRQFTDDISRRLDAIETFLGIQR